MGTGYPHLAHSLQRPHTAKLHFLHLGSPGLALGQGAPGGEQGGSSHHARACSSLFSTSCPTHHLLSSSVLLAQPHLLCYHGLLDGTPSSCEDH